MMATRLVLASTALAFAAGEQLLRGPLLPDAAAVLARPQGVFKELTSRVSELEARVSDMQTQGTEAVARQKAEYDQTLTQQKREIREARRENAGIQQEIDAIRLSNKKIRQHTTSLLSRSNEVMDGIHEMDANLTTASDYILQAMAFAKDSMSAASLEVLSDLAKKDRDQADEAAHEARLREVEGRQAMLLQLGVGLKAPGEAEALVEELTSSLGALAAEQNASSASLKKSFDEAFQAGAEEYRTVLAEQSDLNATRASEEALHTSLLAAERHLVQAVEHVEEGSTAMQHFLGRVAAETIPGTAEVTNDRKAAFVSLRKPVAGHKAGARKRKQLAHPSPSK